MEYHKIKTVWERDPENNYKTLLEYQWSLPEFEYLAACPWIFTEKVDGTNIRVMWDGNGVRFGSKTERGQIPAKLFECLARTFTVPRLIDVFSDTTDVILYGEGFGAGIQKGGGNYCSNQEFVLFDILIGRWWLQRHDVEGIAEALNVPIVPIIGEGDLNNMVDMVREGFNSSWGDFAAEGIVARPKIELKTRSGHRIITKLKGKDFSGNKPV